MTITKKTANEDRLKPILDANPQIDRDTLERARQVEEQLASVGIKLGGYRLEHPLGGPMQPSQQPLRTRAKPLTGCVGVGLAESAGLGGWPG